MDCTGIISSHRDRAHKKRVVRTSVSQNTPLSKEQKKEEVIGIFLCLLTGLSKAANVMNLRNSSHPEETEATDDFVCVKTSITSLRCFLSSDSVSAENENTYQSHIPSKRRRQHIPCLSGVNVRDRVVFRRPNCCSHQQQSF